MDLFYEKIAIQELVNKSELKKVFDTSTRKRLKPKVKNGKRLARRLIKIVSDKHRLEKTVQNIDKLQPFIDDESHPLHSKVQDIILQNGKITVKEAKESQLLNSISDSFYRAIISGESDIDNTRM